MLYEYLIELVLKMPPLYSIRFYRMTVFVDLVDDVFETRVEETVEVVFRLHHYYVKTLHCSQRSGN